jgi:ferredoxin
MSALLTASTRATACSTFTRMSVVDCGACEPVCPVEAIYYEDDLPSQWADYYKANVEFFNTVGSPGGAAKVGKIDGDHEVVSVLPPQGE